ncbi:CopK family periplasmic copper-binding protein [Rhodoferax sp.]|uniref:CopK family periplasmic copper-binding protein n=1 Tax=Rhodoferax sp. TaxID=50421 RepID=UPI0019FB8E35|nr:CopK family periplasmic copper-binding protein [Rhodoferax sp.]MBE0474146.1 CopK family periplasmic copper-binding protein [Rhodoferax sp.]
MSIRKSLVAFGLATVALSSFAATGDAEIVQSTPLQDGSVMHHYKDGKMAMEDKFGRVTSMKDGVKMETRDGKVIVMSGNEVARLFMGKFKETRN